MVEDGDATGPGSRNAEQAGPRPWSETPLETLRNHLANFASERDWEQYHTPRNLLLALVGEAGELCELFQWRLEGEAAAGLPGFSDRERTAVEEELADVLLYLVRLSDVCGIDLGAAALRKLSKNAAKYPAERCRGSSAKYTAYSSLRAANRGAAGGGDQPAAAEASAEAEGEEAAAGEAGVGAQRGEAVEGGRQAVDVAPAGWTQESGQGRGRGGEEGPQGAPQEAVQGEPGGQGEGGRLG